MPLRYRPQQGQEDQHVDWYRPDQQLQIRVTRCSRVPNVYWFEVYRGVAWVVSGSGWGMSLTYFLHKLDVWCHRPEGTAHGTHHELTEDAFPRPVWQHAYFMHDHQRRHYVDRCLRRHQRRHPDTFRYARQDAGGAMLCPALR